ncbi:MAG: hypothetical protein VW806_12520, partial [Halieaceae bacterium]
DHALIAQEILAKSFTGLVTDDDLQIVKRKLHDHKLSIDAARERMLMYRVAMLASHRKGQLYDHKKHQAFELLLHHSQALSR